MDSTNNIIGLEYIYNDTTINIFSDASSKFGESSGLFCYGSMVVNKDTILDQFYAFKDDCTCSYDAELMGLRASLYAALNYIRRFGNQIRNINIFSDSKSAITSILNYKNLACRPIYNNNTIVGYTSYKKNNKKIPSNESILNECISVYLELLSLTNITIFFQPSHTFDKCNKKNVMNHMIEFSKDFSNQNNIPLVSTEFMSYISKYNCIVDEATGLYIFDYYIRSTNNKKIVKSSPIKFNHPNVPNSYYDKRKDVKW